MPRRAPSTPSSNDPAVDTGLPSSYSVVRSPRYQTLPLRSCAYQSNVSSTSTPSSVTVSRTTRPTMPEATRFVRRVTRTTTRISRPSASVSRYTWRAPGRSGRYGLSMRVVKSRRAGESGRDRPRREQEAHRSSPARSSSALELTTLKSRSSWTSTWLPSGRVTSTS